MQRLAEQMVPLSYAALSAEPEWVSVASCRRNMMRVQELFTAINSALFFKKIIKELKVWDEYGILLFAAKVIQKQSHMQVRSSMAEQPALNR